MRLHPTLIAILALVSCAAQSSAPSSVNAAIPGLVRIGPAGVVNGVPALNGATQGRVAVVERCRIFKRTFDEVVACQRANGTLESFTDHQVAWRVRFFVRYERMPCNEAPTVNEAYVFHMVTDDLNNDGDLDYAQRLAIRNAMFHGKVRCTE